MAALLKKCVLLVVLVVVVATAEDICDMCKCTNVQGIIKSVTCDCNLPGKSLDISEEKLTNVPHIEHFSVSNCTNVNFKKNAFRVCHDLKHVTVSRVSTVILNLGVFSSLSTLHVEDVNNLQLSKRAFLGAPLEEISIHRTSIGVLPSMWLKDVIGLRKFQLHSVAIGKIEASAIQVAMLDRDSEFSIEEHCKVEIIEKGAVDIQAGKVFISDAEFSEIRDGAVNITASDGIKVSHNIFQANCSNNGIVVKSNNIDIDSNIFVDLPIGLLQKTADGRIYFTNNVVFNFTLKSKGINLTTLQELDDFRNNRVVCDCNLAKSVVAFKSFESTTTPRDIVNNNYCHVESSQDCQVTLQQIAEDQERMCEGDSSAELLDLCNSSELESDAVHPVPTRGSRIMHPEVTVPSTSIPSTSSTTSRPTTVISKTTSIEDRANSKGPETAFHHISSGGTTARLVGILMSLAVISSFTRQFLTY